MVDRRELLVSAALQVMRREGVAAATTRAICTQADMPLGAFHYCFHSKAELFRLILDSDLQESLENAWWALDPALTAEENLSAVVATYWTAVQADPQWCLVLSELTAHCLRDPELAALPARDYARYHTQVIAQLERFLADSGSRCSVEADTLADILIAGLAGITSSWLAHRRDDIARTSLDAFVEMVAATITPAASS